MSVVLSPEMAAAVRHAVASGEYASASEVIGEALRLWQAHQTAREREIQELRRLWCEGIESGPATPLAFAEIKAKGRSLLAREREAHALVNGALHQATQSRRRSAGDLALRCAGQPARGRSPA